MFYMVKSKEEIEISQQVFSARFQMLKNELSVELPRERSEMSLRQRYMLEKERIKAEIGDLEKIRLTLGLSKRRMCQLLLVDPSAWTRWCKSEAPPHVYQALRWLLELRKTNPSAAEVPGRLDRRVDLLQASTQAKLRDLETSLGAVERAVTLVSAMAPAPAAVADESFERSLRATEMRFQLEVAQLKARIEELLAARRPGAKTGSRRRKPVSKKKTQRKAQGKVSAGVRRARPGRKRSVHGGLGRGLGKKGSAPRRSARKAVKRRHRRSKAQRKSAKGS